MESSSYLSILYTVILLLRVWGGTVTRKNGKDSDIVFNLSVTVFLGLIDVMWALGYMAWLSIK